jgi:hypothetical protein
MRVDAMDENTAQNLLSASVPGYLIRNTSESVDQAKQLVTELGFLPLAIAQAAANILEQQLTLAEYVCFYNDKKHRMGLMQTAAHDFQSTDPRNASQSVHVTWQISFDALKDKFPLSATFLSYIDWMLSRATHTSPAAPASSRVQRFGGTNLHPTNQKAFESLLA